MKINCLLVCNISFAFFVIATLFCTLAYRYPFGLFHPVIACDVKEMNLGTVNSDQDLDCCFVIKNTGNRDLHIKKIVPACGSGTELLVPSLSDAPILPGTSRELKIQFYPMWLQGKALKKAVISSDDPQHPRVVVSIRANVNHITPPESPNPKLAPVIQ